MEEILASIRRIIADDDATKSPPVAAEAEKPAPPAARPAAPPPHMAPPHAAEAEPNGAGFDEPSGEPESGIDAQSTDILELTESMAAPPPAAPAPAPQFRTIDGASDVSFDDAAERPAPPPPTEPAAQLISHSTRAAVDSAFNSLAQTVLVQNARTLEDLVREMLRPMLKSWLDENLPGLVERLVRAEIERVSRGH